MSQLSTKRKFVSDESDEITMKRYKEEKKFKYEVSELIFICSPSIEVDPSFIVNLLLNYDPQVVINHHWAPLSRSSSLKAWYGAVATFSSEAFAKVAVDSIQRKHRFLKVLLFKEISDILLKAELLHPKPSEETTRLIFRAPKLFPENHIPHMKAWLKSFGKLSKAQLHRSKVPDCIVLEVEYPSQFQAYAAKFVMDGCDYKKVGLVSIELIVTESGKEFEKFVKNEFKKCTAEKC